MAKVLRSFKPIVDKRSRVLILGSMPGPEALRKQQYYGFDGNHFWQIVPKLFKAPAPQSYREKLDLIRRNRVALWDVLESCVRPSALDSDISQAKPNNIPGLLQKFPGIRAVFINGRTAHKMFSKKFAGKIDRPVFYLPSTSPAHAALSKNGKLRRWGVIRGWLEPQQS